MNNKQFKQLCFNELTLHPLCINMEEAYSRINNYSKTLELVNKVLGTKVIRYSESLYNIPVTQELSLGELCTMYKRDCKMLLILSSHTMPQINPEEIIADNINCSFDKNGEVTKSDGLSAAYATNTPLIGWQSEAYWSNLMHNIIVADDNIKKTEWPCITSPEHLTQKELQKWIFEHSDVVLIATTLPAAKKEISLRDDHGKDVLQEHAKRICNCEYVERIVCSLPFKPHFRDYIINVADEGLVDIVLYWDDRGLSMRVKTTGRNIQETQKIADILKSQYCK